MLERRREMPSVKREREMYECGFRSSLPKNKDIASNIKSPDTGLMKRPFFSFLRMLHFIVAEW